MLGVEDETTPDGGVARRAVQVLQQRSREEQPFFLAVGFRRPHGPVAAPKRYFSLYSVDGVTLPEAPAAHLRNILPAAKNSEPFHPEKAPPGLRAYYACVSFMDAQVGVLLDALDHLNLWENTLVVFVSDHGYHTGEHGMWHKRTLFEVCAKVPLIVAAPGKQADVCSRVVEMVDLYPTFTQLCGLPTPNALDGASLVPLLDDPDQSWEKPAVTVLGRLDAQGAQGKRTVIGRSVRTERYRYTEWDEGSQGIELYDHTTDPHEFTNLASNLKHVATVGQMRRLLRQYSKTVQRSGKQE